MVLVLNLESFSNNQLPTVGQLKTEIKKIFKKNSISHNRIAIVFDQTDYNGDLKKIIDCFQAIGHQNINHWKSNDYKFWKREKGNYYSLGISKIIEIVSQDFGSIVVVASNERVNSEKIYSIDKTTVISIGAENVKLPIHA